MKRLAILILTLVGLAALALVLFVQFYSPESQRVVLEKRLSEAFGAPAHIGTLKLSLSGGLGVEARNVRVELDSAYGEGSLLEIDEVHANVSVWHFLTTRELGVRTVSVTRPKIRLVKNPDGVWNWATLGLAGSSESARSGLVGLLASASPGVPNVTTSTSTQLRSVDILSANVVLVDNTAQPPVVTEYRGLGIDASIAADAEGRQVTGRITGNSAAEGGEPLDVDVPFDIRLVRTPDPRRWRATGTIQAGRIATRNAQLEEIAATVTLDEAQRLVLPQLRMRMFGGAFDGSAAIDLGTATNRFTLQGRVSELDLARALAPKPDLANVVQGTATASVQLNGELGDYSETLGSLEGSGKADVAAARISSINILGEISKKANLTLVDFSETSTTAERFTTDFRFERGSLRLQNLTATKISGCVELNVPEGRIGIGRQPDLELSGTVTILPEVQNKVRADEPAAQILLAALVRGNGISVPLRVRGPINSPSVELDWATVARSLLFGSLLRSP